MPPLDRIDKLQQALAEGGENIFDLVPAILRNVIKDRLWEQRKDKDGKEFASFETFVKHRLWQGLETTIDDLLLYCRKADDVRSMIWDELAPAEIQGRHVTMSRDEQPARGNNPTYALRRLKRDHPELAARVISGELSANAAAIQAGFRKKPMKHDAEIKEGIEVILAEMAKWHAALEALHQDVRQIKRCVEDKRAEGA